MTYEKKLQNLYILLLAKLIVMGAMLNYFVNALRVS